MIEAPIQIEFLEHFQALQDPRQLKKVLYPLQEILLLVLCGVICDSESWVDIYDYGVANLVFLQRFLPFAKGIPSHDTLGEVFSNLEPKSFQTCFVAWMQSFQSECREIVAIDGKTVRHSFDEHHGAIHMVSAWACHQRMVLAQEKTEEKSNEITAIPKLLEMLMLKGAIVTIDAMGCQREIAQQIVEKGADYVLALKGNQKTLEEDVVEFFEQQVKEAFHHSSVDQYQTLEKNRGRIEKRTYYSSNDVEWLKQYHHDWLQLNSIIMVVSKRTEKGKTSREKRYYISSLPMDAQEIAQAIRSHWQVENCLHWVLDVIFKDDQSRVRKDYSPQNFHMLKQLALNLLTKEPGKKSLRRKRKAANRDTQALISILTAC